MMLTILLFLAISIAATADADSQYIVKFKDDTSYQSFVHTEINVLNVVETVPLINASVINFGSAEAAEKWARTRKDLLYIEKGKFVRSQLISDMV